MEFDYRHNLTMDAVRDRLGALGDYLQNRHGITITWDGDRAMFKGRYLVVAFEGAMTFEDKIVHFRGKDPGFLWRKKASEYIQKKLVMYFDEKTPLEELPRR